LEESLGGSFVYDHYDAVTEYHQQQKLLTEKYFKQRRLDLSPLNTLNADKNEGQQQAVSS
jgi:hypothetical protein